MSETKLHMLMRMLLFQLLDRLFGDRAAIGSEQFIYYYAGNPKQCLAPDAFGKLGASNEPFPIWKVWERGSPELAVEVWSDSDGDAWETKLERYHQLGVKELVLFEMEAPEGERLHVWERIDDDLVERQVALDATPCATLGMFWVVRSAAGLPTALRLAHDAAGARLVPTPDEAEMAAERAQALEKQARIAAERRLAEIEAELKRIKGPE